MAASDKLNSVLADRYEIQRRIGEGGMATVYVARDVRHHRLVAVKVLRPELAAVVGTERFLAEIEITAGLQHPNILSLFDSGEGDGLLYYVMPFVEGESLRTRLDRERQLPLADAVRITILIARALDYAHHRGLIHRDLKPENILLAEGQPVIADFGIALAVSRAAGARITQTGVSLGTPQYMSPEQATGDPHLDGRSDIYSLGAVFYEMLAGTPPHTGTSAQSVIARIITENPRPVTELRPAVTAHINATIQHALAKIPADRIATAGHFADALEAAPHHASHAASPTHPPSTRPWVPVAAGMTLGLIAGAVAMLWTQRGGPEMSATAPAASTSIDLTPDVELALGTDIPPIGYGSPVVAISRAGSWLAYVVSTPTGRMLHLRDMTSGTVRELPGTEGAVHAFFSPDGQEVGFLTPDRVKKIALVNNAVMVLCEARQPVLGWWRHASTIHFTEDEMGTVSRVPAMGGTPEVVIRRTQVGVLWFSDVLPDGQLLAATLGGISGESRDVVLVNPVARTAKPVVQKGYAGRYILPGYILFARGSALLAAPFDAVRGEVTGEPATVASNVASESLFGISHAVSSTSGVLAYVPGSDLSLGKLTWVDRHGRVEQLDAPENVYGALDLSPDDQRIAVHVAGVKDHVLIWDIARRESRRLASEMAEGFPLWSHDGRRLATSIGAWRTPEIVVRDVEPGGAIVDGVSLGMVGAFANAWSSDGHVLATSVFGPQWRVAFVGNPNSVAVSGFEGVFPTFSPDGRWIAYQAMQTGRGEVFIRAYPNGKARQQISVDGGIEPRWSASGELFYRVGDEWFATTIATTQEPSWESQRLVFKSEFIDTPGVSYDVSSDGQRLLVSKRAHPAQRSRIELIPNWLALLERRR